MEAKPVLEVRMSSGPAGVAEITSPVPSPPDSLADPPSRVSAHPGARLGRPRNRRCSRRFRVTCADARAVGRAASLVASEVIET